MAHFPLPIWFDFLATFLFAIAGTLLAIRKGYDIVGVFTVAFVSAVGGGLIRDGLFLQQGPPAITTTGDYLIIIVIGCLIGILFQGTMNRLQFLIALFDALGLGAYAIVGIEKAQAAGLAFPAMVLVGIVNAVGGGVFRDILTREEPLLFRPGQFYAAVAFVGCLIFATLISCKLMSNLQAGIFTILVTFTLRALAIRYNWQTTSLAEKSGKSDTLADIQ
ncbi:MAG: hypothetical protein K0Q50_849 [Vampirovibrio sp.]|jgi:uncharacterized membrane protein YeiH|nr:hypothetical protein [Vampirovibrio sp.]